MSATSLTYSTLIAAVLCISASVAYAQAGSVASPPPLGKLIDVGGYRVHLYCTGTGHPAVIIAGAGYSFDWGLIQPEVAKSTQVCAYDHSSTAWSDPGPADSCTLRVRELHAALRNAGVEGPYVLVGHSRGALVVRLYAAQYPDEAAGIVLVDHAFIHLSGPPVPPPPPAAQSGKSTTFVNLGMDEDPNFKRLPLDDQQLHHWAESQTKNQAPMQADIQAMLRCAADADAVAKKQPHPLGNRPLVDISSEAGAEKDGQFYTKLQSELLSLSSDSEQIVADNSGHFIIIDRPDVVVDGIRQVVNAVRTKRKLLGSTPSP